MSDTQITSEAYQHAELKSEHTRILGVFAFVGFLLVVLVIQTFVVRTVVRPHSELFFFRRLPYL
jgi:hypothetical protein